MDHPPATYPVSMVLTGKPCLVVGGGTVAVRKVRGLLAAGAQVTVIAPAIDPAMPDTVTIHRRPYSPGEAANYRLVVTATGDSEVNGAVYRDAEAAGVWVNAADDPAHCSVLLPAVHRDGPVTVAVSTGGTSPALASWLRDYLANDLEALGSLEELALELSRARSSLKASGRSTESIDWRSLIAERLGVDLTDERP